MANQDFTTLKYPALAAVLGVGMFLWAYPHVENAPGFLFSLVLAGCTTPFLLVGSFLSHFEILDKWTQQVESLRDKIDDLELDLAEEQQKCKWAERRYERKLAEDAARAPRKWEVMSGEELFTRGEK